VHWVRNEGRDDWIEDERVVNVGNERGILMNRILAFSTLVNNQYGPYLESPTPRNTQVQTTHSGMWI